MRLRGLQGLLIAVGFCGGVLCCPAMAAENTAGINFVRDVQPILRRHCDRCHGATTQEAGLTLATAEGLHGKSDSDELVVVPNDVDGSLLWSRIADEEAGDLMPLDGEPLSKRDRNVIRRWIEQGAVLPDSLQGEHWAYVTPKKAKPPKADSDWTRNAIDAFVLRRLESEGLRPSQPASMATLARRVALVLTGLPATPEQIAALESSPNDEGYERLVNELLASPRFGEHWARHWLDLARYADSNGFQADQLRDSWAYRDWVIDAFNADKPFDQFTIEQLAGDLLPNATMANRIATGFHRTPTCNVEAGVHPEANRVNQVFDRINTTGTVFLGTTLECAQCHDHKYDPFTQKDYYQLFAYFNNTPLEVKQTSGVTFDFVGPKMDLPLGAEDQSRIESLETRIGTLTAERDELMGTRDFEAWLEETRASLVKGRAEWHTPKPVFSSTGGESFEVLEDNSVLLDGTLPGSTLYRFEYSGVSGPIVGVRLDTLTHESLPGTGPGRGDVERTNFVLHELVMTVGEGDAIEPVELSNAKASHSQAKYDVSQVVDGKANTGWAIAGEFKKPHWAEFRTVEPCEPGTDDKIVITLDQHFGRGRVIGRPKLSFLIGDPTTADLSDELVELVTSEKRLSKKQRAKLETFHAEQDPAVAKLNRQIEATTKSRNKIKPPTTLVMIEQEESRDTFIMERGDYLAQGEQVDPGTPAALHPLDASLPPTRLGFATWLVDPQNPLLSRVAVNRFWGEVFGRGLVSTPEDFGTQSESPTHPELLDWLAVDFIEQGWSVKQLLKQIVMSSTFRQDSSISQSLLARDPDNSLLARGPRYRLSAEAIRDNSLAIAGLLSDGMAGEPIMPYQPDGIWRAVGRNQPKWNAAANEKRYRRGIYVIWKRGAPYPSFVTFDAPDRAACTVKRPRTNTPLQALVLLNDLAYGEAAIGLSQRMLREAPSSSWESIAATGYELATGRKASERAIEILVGLAQDEAELLKKSPQLVEQRIEMLPKPFRDETLDAGDVAAWFAVANALLNLDDVITVH